MIKYSLALVGRPNVGKSALFNRICRSRLAIVDSTAGSTRDRLMVDTEWFGKHFTVMDAGGLDPSFDGIQAEAVQLQTKKVIEQAHALIMVVDAQIGVTASDLQIARLLHQSNKPLILAVNKVDAIDQDYLMHAFHSLNIKKMLPVSALHGFNIAELVEAACVHFPLNAESYEAREAIPVAILGRTNVGKSTLLNSLVGETRSIVSPEIATTRDSVAMNFKVGSRIYQLIDTAGIRRAHAEKSAIEKFAAIRTQESIIKADVCLLVLDVQDGFTAQDKRIAKQIDEAGKSCLILLNKWDRIHGFRMEHCIAALQDECPHRPILCISAKTKRNLDKIWPEVDKLHYSSSSRISTHQLNKFLSQIFQSSPPPAIKGKRLRLYYATQAETKPPVFVLFVNHPSYMAESYKRFLANRMRNEFELNGVPIELVFKGKENSRPSD